MIYFVFDNPKDKNKMQFLYDYDTKIIKQVYPNDQVSKVREQVAFTRKIILESKKDDTLIFWYDFMGILCWWICKITFKRRNIVIINILLKKKKGLKNYIARCLYKATLSDTKIKVTVTSMEYGEWLNKLLNLKRKYILLHDIYYGDAFSKGSDGGYVFCGGKNGRDWKKLIDIAQRLSQIDFKCVMPISTYKGIASLKPDNVTIVCDVKEDRFLKLLNQSNMIVMPLDTEAPAGLITFFQAASYKKLVITSNTAVTREYINENNGVLCGNLDEWCEKIKYYMDNVEIRNSKAQKLNQYLNQVCSKEMYATTLWKLTNE